MTLAARVAHSDSVRKALARNPDLKVAEPAEAVSSAEVVFLATPFQAVERAIRSVQEEVAGKILVDCTNPVGPGLKHGLDSQESGSERIACALSSALVVKAFAIYGFENFEDKAFPGSPVKPAMFFCGESVAAKAVVADLISKPGWDPLDVGGLDQALHLEHMTLLWIRMVRVHGHSPRLVWAALKG